MRRYVHRSLVAIAIAVAACSSARGEETCEQGPTSCTNEVTMRDASLRLDPRATTLRLRACRNESCVERALVFGEGQEDAGQPDLFCQNPLENGVRVSCVLEHLPSNADGARPHMLLAIFQTNDAALLRDGDVYRFSLVGAGGEMVFDSGAKPVRYLSVPPRDACATPCRVASF